MERRAVRPCTPDYDGDFLNPGVGDLHNLNESLYFLYYNGTAYTYGQMHNAGQAIIGNPSSWSISPALPEDLTLEQQWYDLGNADSLADNSCNVHNYRN